MFLRLIADVVDVAVCLLVCNPTPPSDRASSVQVKHNMRQSRLTEYGGGHLTTIIVATFNGFTSQFAHVSTRPNRPVAPVTQYSFRAPRFPMFVNADEVRKAHTHAHFIWSGTSTPQPTTPSISRRRRSAHKSCYKHVSAVCLSLSLAMLQMAIFSQAFCHHSQKSKYSAHINDKRPDAGTQAYVVCIDRIYGALYA